ncbi:response regulator transcription factor [Virgibacillus sp. LDC-1]|uniref:response regulator n=1 Tax=Virgibacillus sp. LDC-1 TaxID=3039856 RepID=UPI0024DDFC6E|nr:response regulator transcription factor [Virgibacillus sp. LDC-1]
MINIMVVDDHVLIRKGIVLLLENFADIQIVGEASSGEEAIVMAAQTQPDVILMDISMPGGLDGFTATQKILHEVESAKVILLTMHEEEVYIQKAIEVKAHGYIFKNSQGGDLHEAITTVNSGKRFFRVDIPDEQLEKWFEDGTQPSSILTLREQEIVRLTILGYSNKQMSEKLFISPKTVENHKTNIMQKLNLTNKAELIQYGIKNHFMH